MTERPNRATDLPAEPLMDQVVDQGLALERTLLAWQRTGIALMAAGGIAFRFISYRSPGPVPVVIGLTGIVLGLAALVWVRMRDRSAHAGLAAHGHLGARGGGALALVALSTLAVALIVALFPVLNSLIGSAS